MTYKVEEIDTKLNESMTDSLDGIDPWMKNKIDKMNNTGEDSK